MAVVLGTNAGFVAEAPVADPAGNNQGVMDAYRMATKDTAPEGATSITEIGWWCDTASQESNFEVGLYSHNAETNRPDTRLYVADTNAKGTTSGWKTVEVDWAITPGTVYWIAVQLDDTATTTWMDWQSSGNGRAYTSNATDLPVSFDAAAFGDQTAAFYAVYTSGGEEVNISGTITAVSSIPAATLTVKTIVGISGTVAATSTATAAMTVKTSTPLSGTISAVSTVGGALGSTMTVKADWQTETFRNLKRMILFSADALFYEDLE